MIHRTPEANESIGRVKWNSQQNWWEAFAAIAGEDQPKIGNGYNTVILAVRALVEKHPYNVTLYNLSAEIGVMDKELRDAVRDKLDELANLVGLKLTVTESQDTFIPTPKGRERYKQHAADDAAIKDRIPRK